MFILEVLPLLAIPRTENQILSYFSSQALPPRSLVQIPIRNRLVEGLVLESQPVRDIKIKLKKEAGFELKPIKAVLSSKPIISQFQLDIALWLSSYYFAPLGLSLKMVLPSWSGKKKYPWLNFREILEDKSSSSYKTNYIATKNLHNHYKDYEDIISKNLDRDILIIVPEVSYLDYFYSHYKPFKPIIFHRGLNNQDQYAIYKKITENKKCFVIGTRTALFLPFYDLGLIILDQESNDSSRSDSTPKYETGKLAEFVARRCGATLIKNDLVPRTETFYQHQEVFKSKENNSSPQTIEFIDLVKELKNNNFSIFSKTLQEAIINNYKDGKNLILFVPRKGYARFLICGHCYQPVLCSQCQIPMFVHQEKNEKFLLCHRCQIRKSLIKVCPNCQNFILNSKGFGTQKVIIKTLELFERNNLKSPTILEFNQDVLKNAEEEKGLVKKMADDSPLILVATQKILSWQYLIRVGLTGILNLELNSSFPDFRTNEKTLRLVSTLRQMSEKTLVQTYQPSSAISQFVQSEDLASFFQEELRYRKLLSFPPFTELVRLNFYPSRSSKLRDEPASTALRLKREIEKNNWPIEVIGPYLDRSVSKSGPRTSIMLKVKNLEVKKRNALLRLLTVYWQIEINPRE